ncbi:phosphopantetheine-binding protein [Streptomyces sp. NBC_01304]|uniref:phosphopantetheine-binding protein n=1 Tax=Streptomyces sp. NBC_01304 TaxID=2903818 RepID=UPI002E15AF3B|nr:phosphopantetheine-binding protein [Streptomyces sp. NBC_01304]
MTAPHVAAADVLGELVGALAGVLRLKPEKIDPEQTFRSLGLDSLLTVEFVATVNARYGIKIKADALFDHPTPLAFARHVARELGVPSPASRASAVEPERAVQAQAPVAAEAQGPVVTGGPSAYGEQAVLDVLREELARILCCDPWDIDTTASFNLLGLDSILGAEFVAVVNHTYHLHERAVMLYEHPNLAAIAAHIAALGPGSAPAAPAAPVRQATPAPAPRPAGTGPTDIDALLDAVQVDRLTVDEALDLLARRS